MTYQIREEKSQMILATDLNDEQLAQWWKENQDKYFGLRVNEAGMIEVADTKGWVA